MIPQYHLNFNRSPKLKDFGKKGVFNWTKLVIGILLFSLFVVVLGGAYMAMANTYNVPVADKYAKLNDRVTQVTNKTTAIGEQYQGGNLQDTNTLILAGSSVYSGFQIILGAIGIPKEMIASLVSDLPIIPKIFIDVLLALLAIGFVYIVGSGFARWFT